MEREIKHILLWKEGKIRYSVTRFSNIMPDLLEAGVKTYFVYPKHEILQESITLLLQELHIKTMMQNQNAITALNQQLSDGTCAAPSHFAGTDVPSPDQKTQSELLACKTGLSLSYAQCLLAGGVAKEMENQAFFTRGRPEKIYRIHMELIR